MLLVLEVVEAEDPIVIERHAIADKQFAVGGKILHVLQCLVWLAFLGNEGVTTVQANSKNFKGWTTRLIDAGSTSISLTVSVRRYLECVEKSIR